MAIVIGPAPKEGMDQRDELQAWIDSLAPGDTAKLKMVGPKGSRVAPSYICEETLFFRNLVGVRFVTNGAKLKRTSLKGSRVFPGDDRPSWSQQLRIEMCRDTIIRFGRIESAGDGSYHDGQEYEGEHAVAVRGGENLVIEIDDIVNPGSDWFNIAHHEPGGQQRLEARNIFVGRRENADEGGWVAAGRQGISITGRVVGVTFDDSLILGYAPRSMLDIELNNDSDYVRDVTFSPQWIDGCGNFILANGGAGTSDGVHVIGVSTPQLKFKVGNSRGVVNRFNLEIRANVGTETHEAPEKPVLYAQGLQGLTLVDNIQEGEPNPVGYIGTVSEPIVHEGNSWQT